MGKSKKDKNGKDRPRIRFMASLWTLTGYGSKKKEWSVDQKLERIKKSGFDGFCGRVPLVTLEQVAKSGLIFEATIGYGLREGCEAKT